MKKKINTTKKNVVQNKMTALVESSCSRYYTCNVGVNDDFVSMKISSPINATNSDSEEIIRQLNDSGNLTYRLYLENGILYVSKVFEKMSNASKESIVEIISNMVANLDTAIMALTK